MKKTAVLLMILGILTKLLGFGRDIVLSYYYGVSGISDAYLISITIPTLILAIIGTGITTTFIPIYSEIEKNHGVLKADKFTNNIINLILVVCSFMVIIVLLFTGPVVKMFASGFSDEIMNLAIRFTRITIFSVYFACMIYILKGYLEIKNNFLIPAIMNIPLNLTVIASIVLSSIYGTDILAYGLIAGIGLQMAYQIPFAKKKGLNYTFVLDYKDKYVKKMMILSAPVIIGVSVNQINVLVDRTIASNIVIGGISALTYSNRFNLFIQAIFITSIATVMYPRISKMATENNIDSLKKTVTKAINSINLLVIPAAIGTMIFAKPIIVLLFGRGEFDIQAINMTASTLFYYSIGMIGFGLREVLSRVFYSLHNTKIPMINASIAVILNIVLNIILSNLMGIAGLALATSISAIFCTCLLFISLRNRIGSIGMKNITKSFLKIIFASLIMSINSKVCFVLLQNTITNNLALVLSIGIGVISYIICIYFSKIEFVDELVNEIRRRYRI